MEERNRDLVRAATQDDSNDLMDVEGLLEDPLTSPDVVPPENIPLIIENIPFAKKLATQFYRKRLYLGVERQEYEGAAYLGLCDAARRFDASRGLNFKTFSYLRIRGAMFDLLRRGGLVTRGDYNRLVESHHDRVTSEIPDTGDKLEKASSQLPYTFARTSGELAGLLDAIDEIGIKLHLNADNEVVDLSYTVELNPETSAALNDMKSYLWTLVEKLPNRERKLITSRYFEGYSFDEIREQFGGISKSCISRIHTRALDSLRKLMTEENMKCSERIERFTDR